MSNTTIPVQKGIQSLRQAIMKDCKEGNNCFSETGCIHERYKIVPQENPNLIAMGITTECRAQTKCMHDYCGKYKWILERAAHYAEKIGIPAEDVLTRWEENRTYWYMNYYQEAKQPLLTSDKVILYDDWISQLKQRFGDKANNWAFKCPACGHVQTIQMFIDHKIESPNTKVYFSCIGRYVPGIGCNWTLGGLFQIHKLSVLKDAIVFPVFEMADKPLNP